MAIAKKCDICGKLYERYNTDNDFRKPNGIGTLNVNTHGKYMVYVAMDCCPECMESINAHISYLRGASPDYKINPNGGKM